jgi:site-specific recombinase XerC
VATRALDHAGRDRHDHRPDPGRHAVKHPLDTCQLSLMLQQPPHQPPRAARSPPHPAGRNLDRTQSRTPPRPAAQDDSIRSSQRRDDRKRRLQDRRLSHLSRRIQPGFLLLIRSWRPRSGRKTTSTNKRASERTIAAAVKRCLRELERAPLAPRTKDAYGQHIAAYGAWLAGRRDGAKALIDPKSRDYAARDFKRHLKVDRGWKPASVNLALAAVDHFNRFLGLGPADIKREPLAQAAPRALEVEQQRDLLRAAEATKARDRAIVTLLLYTALRLHELVALDIDDVSISARKGLLVIRSGKGDLYREVPLNPSCRHALTDWLRDRAAADGERALFTGPQGRRLSARAVDLVVRNVAAQAELKLSAHTLRHTCVTNLVRSGNDLVLVAELAGHRRLELRPRGDTAFPRQPTGKPRWTLSRSRIDGRALSANSCSVPPQTPGRSGRRVRPLSVDDRSPQLGGGLAVVLFADQAAEQRERL